MNHYEILGVDKAATPVEIKKAYKRMAKKHHPDRNGGDNTQMVLVNKAYDTLMDPAKREHYDLTGEEKPTTSLDIEATNTIIKAFAQLMQMGKGVNIPVRAKSALNEARGTQTREISSLQDRRRNLIARRDEVKVEGAGVNLWHQLIDSGLQDVDGKLAQCERNLEVVKRALEMLEAYRSGVIEKAAPGMFTPTGGSAIFEAMARAQRGF